MNILQVMAGARHGGAETAFVDMCLALQGTEHKIEVITRSNAIRVPALQKAGIKVHTLPFGGAIDFYTGWKIKKIIKDFAPDIIQSWMARAASKVPSYAGLHSKNASMKPFVHCARLGGYYDLKYFSSCDNFICITPAIADHVKQAGIKPEKLIHINNFAETEEIKTPIKRAEYGVPETATLVLGLGRLHTAKAFDILINAVAELSNTYLWIAGEGPERENLEKLIIELNAQDRIKLLGWREDRAALLQAADICSFTSRYEPFGTVFVQSWAQKTPVIVSEADGPKQFVNHEEDGLMVPIDNGEALKESIQKLAKNKQLTEKLIKNGFLRYENEFQKEKCVGQYLNYYKEIISQKPLSQAA